MENEIFFKEYVNKEINLISKQPLEKLVGDYSYLTNSDGSFLDNDLLFYSSRKQTLCIEAYKENGLIGFANLTRRNFQHKNWQLNWFITKNGSSSKFSVQFFNYILNSIVKKGGNELHFLLLADSWQNVSNSQKLFKLLGYDAIVSKERREDFCGEVIISDLAQQVNNKQLQRSKQDNFF